MKAKKKKLRWHKASEFRAASSLESAAAHKKAGLDRIRFIRMGSRTP